MTASHRLHGQKCPPVDEAGAVDDGGLATPLEDKPFRGDALIARVLAETIAARDDALIEAEATRRQLEVVEATRSYRLARLASAVAADPKRVAGLPGEVLRTLRSPPVTSDAREFLFETSPRDSLGCELRLVAVVDPITQQAMAGECDLFLAGPSCPIDAIREFKPHGLFVESGWLGWQGLWRDKIHPGSKPLLDLINNCRTLGVPTIFWNKEDPVHFSRFLGLARHFDFVFTTDVRLLDSYRAVYPHPRYGVLPFACQPRIHHPLTEEAREVAAVFAGSFYRKYDRRCDAFQMLATRTAQAMPVHLYDRNSHSIDPHLRFPDIPGVIKHDTVHAADMGSVYRRYLLGLNVNTVEDSPTMLSRRVFEMLACNLIVASDHSEASEAMFGNSVLHEPSLADLVDVAKRQPMHAKRAVLGLRLVMEAHTWAHRTSLIAEVCGVSPAPDELPTTVLASVSGDDSARRLAKDFSEQSVKGARLILVRKEGDHADDLLHPGVHCMDASSMEAPLPPTKSLAIWSESCRYGPNYLKDLELARTYAPHSDAVGKKSGCDTDIEYSKVDSLEISSSLIFNRALFDGTPIGAWVDGQKSGFSPGNDLVLIDGYNFQDDISTPLQMV